MWLPYKIFYVILHILLLPLTLSLLLFLVFYKLTVLLFAKIFQDFSEPITGPDSLFLADHIWSRPHSSILVGFELNGSPSEEETVQLFQKVYDNKDEKGQRCYRELGYFLVRYFGYGFWKVVPNFKISDRIHLLNRESGLGQPDVSSTTSSTIHDEPLASLVEGMLRQPYELEQPLWDVYVLHNFKGYQNRTLVLLRFHHLMADGLSFVKLFYALVGITKMPSKNNKASTSMQRWHRIRESFPLKAYTLLTLLTVGLVEYVYDVLYTRDKHCLQFTESGKSKLTGNWICSLGRKMDLAELKRAGAGYGSSLVHIFFAGINRGLERYFFKYHGKEQLPEGIHIICPLPVPKHPDLRLVNHWCLAKFYAKFGMEQTDVQMEYLKKEALRCATKSWLPLTSACTFKYVCGYLPTALINFISKSKAAATFLLSNVVGPQDCTLLAGIISCNGKARICLTADMGCIPDRSRLEDLGMMMHDELQDICNPKTKNTEAA